MTLKYYNSYITCFLLTEHIEIMMWCGHLVQNSDNAHQWTQNLVTTVCPNSVHDVVYKTLLAASQATSLNQ